VQRCSVADQKRIFSGGCYPGQDYDPYGGTPVGGPRILRLTHPFMTGPDVEEVLIRLKNRGYYQGKLDSTYGPLAEAAVRQFQHDNRLGYDGKVGPLTRRALGI